MCASSDKKQGEREITSMSINDSTCATREKQRRWLSCYCTVYVCTSSKIMVVLPLSQVRLNAQVSFPLVFLSASSSSVFLFYSSAHLPLLGTSDQIIFTINTFKIVVAEENCSLLHNIKRVVTLQNTVHFLLSLPPFKSCEREL